MLDKIQADLKQAMLDRNSLAVDTLKMLKASLQNAAIDKGGELDDSTAMRVIKKEATQREEAAVQYEAAQKQDMAEKERAEKKILEVYLPEQISDEALAKIIDQVVSELGASSMQEMGAVIGAVKAKTEGQADGGTIATMVKTKLSK